MATIQKYGGYILQHVERQTPFNPDEMDIERKLLAWICVGTLHQIYTTWSSKKEI